MTDGASAFSLTAAQLKQKHLLCVHHFRTNMVSCCANMSKDVSDLFIKQCNSLIFKVFSSDELFKQLYSEVISKFCDYPAAKKFIISIFEQREKVCATYTVIHHKIFLLAT